MVWPVVVPVWFVGLLFANLTGDTFSSWASRRKSNSGTKKGAGREVGYADM